MDMDLKMTPVIRDINYNLGSDPDRSAAEQVRRARNKWNLDEAEVRYLCRHFHLLTEDVREEP